MGTIVKNSCLTCKYRAKKDCLDNKKILSCTKGVAKDGELFINCLGYDERKGTTNEP